MARKLSRTLTDHDEIRRWAEERGGSPAAVGDTARGEEDPGIIRIDFPGYSGEGQLQPVSWDEWFEKFDRSSLALVVQDETSGGERSNFNKLVSREGSPRRGGARRRTAATTSSRGARATSRARSRTGRATAKGRGAKRAGGGRPAGRTSGRRAAATRTTARSASRRGAAGRKAGGRRGGARGAGRRGGKR